jgi:hypothetical protein
MELLCRLQQQQVRMGDCIWTAMTTNPGFLHTNDIQGRSVPGAQQGDGCRQGGEPCDVVGG